MRSRQNGVKDIVAGSTGTARETSKHGLAGLAVVGIVGISAVVAGWGVSPVEPRAISPADVIALRFPSDWSDEAAVSAPAEAPATFALASAESRPIEASILFSPQQTYRLPAGTLTLAPMPTAVDARADPHLLDPQSALPTDIEPAAKLEAKPETRVEARPEAKPESASKLDAKPDAKAESRTAAARAPARARKESSVLFNDAQLASIKSRLKLSADQEQYWPSVASALRDIGWRAAHNGNPGNGHTRLAAIDPDSPEVQRLKSAAFPLIMSMNDDQKREVRTLAQVMGLERVAASF